MGRQKNIYFDSENTMPREVAASLCRSSDDDGQCTVIMAFRGTSSKIEVMTDIGFVSTVAVTRWLDPNAGALVWLPAGALVWLLLCVLALDCLPVKQLAQQIQPRLGELTQKKQAPQPLKFEHSERDLVVRPC